VRSLLTSFSLASLANAEHLAFIGTGNFTGTGNGGANSITGGAGNDTLDGGVGNDTLTGGLGDDIYLIEGSAESVVEAAGAGTDEIRTSQTTYNISTLTNIENLTYTGTLAFTGTGNAGANVITGGSGNDTIIAGDGNDTIDGGTGTDSMTGGLGNDVFFVNVATDVVVEAAGGGTDEIRTSVATSTIASLANVENLTYTGTLAFTGTGNTGANAITGGTGNDTLSGGDGADTLTGGNGADSLSGGNQNDSIVGGAGLDTLLGGQGADILTGGANADTFRWLAGDTTGGPDSITDFTAGAGGDVLDLDALLGSYVYNAGTISQYVNLQEVGGNTNVRIDAAGTSTFTTTVVTLQGVTGLDLASLRSNGNLVV
jgi:Ca2+-binding RTX toxin-like protein